MVTTQTNQITTIHGIDFPITVGMPGLVGRYKDHEIILAPVSELGAWEMYIDGEKVTTDNLNEGVLKIKQKIDNHE